MELVERGNEGRAFGGRKADAREAAPPRKRFEAPPARPDCNQERRWNPSCKAS